MSRPTTAGIDDVQQGQLAGHVIDCKGADAARRPPSVAGNFIHGVEVPAGGVKRQEAWIVGFRGQAHRCELSGGSGELVNVDPLALRTGVGTDVDELVDLAGRFIDAARVNNAEASDENCGKENCTADDVFHAPYKSAFPRQSAREVWACQRDFSLRRRRDAEK